jgi:hypothetical protein
MDHQEGEDPQEFQENFSNHRMLVLKNNHIPKGLIPLERLFDHNDMPLKSNLQPQLEEVEYCDVGTKEEPRMVKISKYLPSEVNNKYKDLLARYKVVFSWSYEEIRTYKTIVIEHNIPLKPGVKPFRKKLRQINPILLPVVEREVRKKSGDIRLCVDFRYLNKSSLKYNYPLPKMDHVLEKVVGENRMSMIDDFSRYNQIAVNEQDK